MNNLCLSNLAALLYFDWSHQSLTGNCDVDLLGWSCDSRRGFIIWAVPRMWKLNSGAPFLLREWFSSLSQMALETLRSNHLSSWSKMIVSVGLIVFIKARALVLVEACFEWLFCFTNEASGCSEAYVGETKQSLYCSSSSIYCVSYFVVYS